MSESDPASQRRAKTAAEERPHDELAGLAAAATQGDEAALGTLLATLIPHLLRVVRKILGPTHPDLDDVTQDAAMAVAQSLITFRGEASVLHFACRIGVLTAMNVRRNEARLKRKGARADADPDELGAAQPSPEAALASTSLIPVVQQLLAELSPPIAEALALHCMIGYTVAEIARASGAPEETIRSRLRLAKQALRKRVLSDPRLRQIIGVEP